MDKTREKLVDFSSLFNALRTNDIIETLNKIHKPQIKSFNNITYMNFYTQGYSLCFKNEALDSVFYYNQDINHYTKYPFALPYRISFDMKNVHIVQHLGDTPKKGGGKEPIFLSYPHLGIEITFLSSNWNDLDNPIIYISQFVIDTNELYCSTCTKKLNQLNSHLTCNNSDCLIVNYCNNKCKSHHIKYHLLYCINKNK